MLSRMPSVLRTVLALACLSVFAPAAGAVCAGDCDTDEAVGVSELVRSVYIALGNQPLSNCPAIHTNISRSVAINELIAAVGAALNGCPVATPTATPRPTPSGGIDPIFPANYR